MTPSLPLQRILVERLARNQARTVYPLMQQIAPTLSLERWLNYANRFCDRDIGAKAGMLVARRDSAAHPSGAVCYQRNTHLEYGSMLGAEHFIALDGFFPGSILSALLTELDGIAAVLGCPAIRSIVNGRRVRSTRTGLLGGPQVDEALWEELHCAGYVADGVTLLKVASSPQVANPVAAARRKDRLVRAGHPPGS